MSNPGFRDPNLLANSPEAGISQIREEAKGEGNTIFEKKYAQNLTFLSPDDRKVLQNMFVSIYSMAKENERNGDALFQESVKEFAKTRPNLTQKERDELVAKLNEASGEEEGKTHSHDIPEVIYLKRLVAEGHTNPRFNIDEFIDSLSGESYERAKTLIVEKITAISTNSRVTEKVVAKIEGTEGPMTPEKFEKSEFFEDIAKKAPAHLELTNTEDSFNHHLATFYTPIESKSGETNPKRDYNMMLEMAIKDFKLSCRKEFLDQHAALFEEIESSTTDPNKRIQSFRDLFRLKNQVGAHALSKNIVLSGSTKKHEDIQGLLQRSKATSESIEAGRKHVRKMTQLIEHIETQIIDTLKGTEKQKVEMLIAEAKKALTHPEEEIMLGTIKRLEAVVNSPVGEKK